MKQIVTVLALIVALGCASLPVKQQAAVTLQSVSFALETSRNLERGVCDSTAALSAVLTSCSLQAHQLGLSDEKHQKISKLFSISFTQVADSSDAFYEWTPIEARPSLSQAVSTLHLIKVELQPLVAHSAQVASVVASIDKALALIEKVQGLK